MYPSKIRCPFCHAEWGADSPHATQKLMTFLAIHLAQMQDEAHARWRWDKLTNLTHIYREIEAATEPNDNT